MKSKIIRVDFHEEVIVAERDERGRRVATEMRYRLKLEMDLNERDAERMREFIRTYEDGDEPIDLSALLPPGGASMSRRDRRATAAYWRGRKIPDWVPEDKRALFVQGAESAAGRGAPPEGYVKTARATVLALEGWLGTFPLRPRPRFRLPGDRELAVAASLFGIGHRLALTLSRVPYDACGFSELGLVPRGGGGGYSVSARAMNMKGAASE